MAHVEPATAAMNGAPDAVVLSAEGELIEHAPSHDAPGANGELVALPASGNPLDVDVRTFAAALERRGENRKALMAWLKEALIEGVDYGRIHVAPKKSDRKPHGCPNPYNCTNPNHYSKPSLFKPGAEKICGMLGLRVTYPSLPAYEAKALAGERIDHIMIICHLIDASGAVVGEGAGARAVSQDGGDINKAIKMSLKSSHIDSTLRCAGLSEVYTQDVEDMGLDTSRPAPREQRRTSNARAPAPAKTPEWLCTHHGKALIASRDWETLRRAWINAWRDAKHEPDAQAELQAIYERCKRELGVDGEGNASASARRAEREAGRFASADEVTA